MSRAEFNLTEPIPLQANISRLFLPILPFYIYPEIKQTRITSKRTKIAEPAWDGSNKITGGGGGGGEGVGFA